MIFWPGRWSCTATCWWHRGRLSLAYSLFRSSGKQNSWSGCASLARFDFWKLPLWKLVMVLKGLYFGNFYFVRMWLSWKHQFWTAYFGRVWWTSNDWFWVNFTFKGCVGLVRTDFGKFLLWECVVVLKWLMLDSFHFRRFCGLEEINLWQFWLGRIW